MNNELFVCVNYQITINNLLSIENIGLDRQDQYDISQRYLFNDQARQAARRVGFVLAMD